METQLKKGFLDYIVLATIKKERSYGYKIIQNVSEVIEISESTLYPILKRLEKGKLITSCSVEYNGRLRKYFSITEEGINKLNEFKNDLTFIEKMYNYIMEDSPNEQN